MRIDAFDKINRLYNTSDVKSTARSKGAGFNDTLEISQAGKDYQTAKQIVARVPDIRETKVDDIKRRMDAGAYNVTVEEVADKLIDKYFNETI